MIIRFYDSRNKFLFTTFCKAVVTTSREFSITQGSSSFTLTFGDLRKADLDGGCNTFTYCAYLAYGSSKLIESVKDELRDAGFKIYNFKN